MKRILFFIIIAFCAIGMNAQDYSWVGRAPQKYMPSTTKIITTRTSACNQGEEAFMDFIPKFRTDKKFRDSRIRIETDSDDETAREMTKAMVENFENWQAIKAGKGINKRGSYRYWGSWYDVSADMVCFKSEETAYGAASEYWGGSSSAFRFQRIGGRWYLTGMMVFG